VDAIDYQIRSARTEAVPDCCLGPVTPTAGAVTPGGLALLVARFIIATPAALPAIALSIGIPAAVPLLVLVLALLLTCGRHNKCCMVQHHEAGKKDVT
jgi:hypothetical protein